MPRHFELFRKSLRLACDSSTSPHEAHTAAMKAKTFLEQGGEDIDDLFTDAAFAEESREFKTAFDSLKKAFDESNEAMKAAHAALAELKSENSRLSDLNNILRADNEKLERALHDSVARNHQIETEFGESYESRRCSDKGAEYVSFENFARTAASLCRRSTWKPAVAMALGLSLKELSAWGVVGVFPARLAARLDLLKEEERAPSSRQRWTNDELNLLKVALSDGDSDLEVAVKLTAVFGRRVYESSIINQRRRIQREEGWSPPLRSTRSRSASATTVH